MRTTVTLDDALVGLAARFDVQLVRPEPPPQPSPAGGGSKTRSEPA
jgi:hypothetical protein